MPGPRLKSVPPLSRFGPRLLHTSNIVFTKLAPLVIFDPHGCDIQATMHLKSQLEEQIGQTAVVQSNLLFLSIIILNVYC